MAVFVGREQALSSLLDALATGPGIISHAIIGLGGVGKSELALQYAHRHQDDYRLVWWMEADSAAHIQAGLAELARALVAGVDSVAAEQATTEEAAAWSLAWLSSHTGWLVVFDNVEEAVDVDSYLARLTRGRVLITTRRDIGWAQRGITPQRLEVLDRPASIALLADLIGTSTADHSLLLDELGGQLGDLPLALAQAGAYIARTPRVTPARYLQLLKETPARMHAAVPVGGESARVMAKVWALSHGHIQTLNPLAVHVLNVLSCYAPDNLPVTVLDGLDEDDSLAVDEALELLASYSLITLTTSSDLDLSDAPKDLVSVHRLVQTVIFHQFASGQREALRRRAAFLLQAALPDDADSPVNWPSYRHLLPHARAILPLDSPGLSKVLHYLDASGDHATALALQRQIHAHHLHTSGPEHPQTLITQANLAFYIGKVGGFAAARDQFATLLPTIECVFGANHPDTLATRHELARWTGEAGNAAAARDQYATLLPVCKRILGTEHPDTLTTRQRFADWMGKAGDLAAARDQLAALLPIRERILGTEHPDTLATRRHLANWTGHAGDLAAACGQLAALLPVSERVLGNEHPDTLTAHHDLAHWMGQVGDGLAARGRLIALLSIRQQILGSEHPDALATHSAIANWTGQLGDAAAARDQLAALLPIRERILGTEHPTTLTNCHNLAHWTGKAGDAAAARDQFAVLLPIREHTLGAEHPDSLIARHSLAYWTGEAGDAAAARDQLAALLPIRERILGIEHPDTLDTRHELARWADLAGWRRAT
ncbi:tetratricopeptide repeat protein [Nonomuraea sp. NEAU-A123]|nr:tetratricopeptide repeat protein [Nonomuraea sp. NEAU-A123]